MDGVAARSSRAKSRDMDGRRMQVPVPLRLRSGQALLKMTGSAARSSRAKSRGMDGQRMQFPRPPLDELGTGFDRLRMDGGGERAATRPASSLIRRR